MVITKLASVEDVLVGLAAGADDYLGKPFGSMSRARIGAMLRSPEYGFQGCLS
ncbi:hypothetical protein LFT44_21355 (plasmid) [Arthrobacter sp. FW306-05-C]|uniref:hypothetical protein n=1 Tax=unclassified Arthrobacter TaxID=235627 RepID=UPI001EF02246|nr:MULTISPECIES: hypothetical protein [unclassified Arthrobacter]UKA69072.1 hypothetical protein LFT44_21355 [Arthrobacter sp. FW306-05-C]UKA70919.1 hypothetical protein LFT49_19735 [Arthrobacter sp. FW306-06-A]